MLHLLASEVVNPPALVQAQFDEARAVAECKALIERRDEAKGEYKSTVLLLGQKLMDARRAMPGKARADGSDHYSSGFLAFIEKIGITKLTAGQYMGFARNPDRHKTVLAYQARRDHSSRRYRRKTLQEVSELLAQAPDLETARRVIQEELDEVK